LLTSTIANPETKTKHAISNMFRQSYYASFFVKLIGS
jgi:hypothetical protein